MTEKIYMTAYKDRLTQGRSVRLRKKPVKPFRKVSSAIFILLKITWK